MNHVSKVRSKLEIFNIHFARMYPKIRLAEEGAVVVVVGVHPAGQKYTGKYGYPVKRLNKT